MTKICFITATRAEYGLLKPLLARFQSDPRYELQIVATGAHLSKEFGYTVQSIVEDGFAVSKKIEMLLSSDTKSGLCKAMGLLQISLAEAVAELEPDLVVILGDRYEMLSAASCFLIYNIPIVHISGGEITEGAIDDAVRHSLTKMSQLHFTSTEEYRRRVVQLGEEPSRVFNVGALGVENTKKTKLMTKAELEKELRFSLNGDPNILVTYHPATLGEDPAVVFTNLLSAVSGMKNCRIVFTKANADYQGSVINSLIDDYVAGHPENSVSFTSLGQVRYLSLLKCSDIVLGNSSSGIIEAPSFGVPTVNIGDRQKGRTRADSVIDCQGSVESIKSGIASALSEAFQGRLANVVNPYDKEDTTNAICREIDKFSGNLSCKKKFFDLSFEE